MQDGQLIAKRRKQLGWTQEHLADLYGDIMQGSPVSQKAIDNMEKKHGLPKDPKRRAILATLLGIPLAAVGVNVTTLSLETLVPPSMKTGPIDLVEYRSALKSYDRSMVGDGCDWIIMTTDILSRIQALHNKAWYAGAEKIEMVQLLCGFHMVVGDIASEQRLQDAVACFNNAIILAKEYKLDQQYAYALYRRGAFFQDSGNLAAARRDYHEALAVKHLPEPLKGQLLSGASKADAFYTQDEEDVEEALELSDEAEQFIGDTIKESPLLIKFDEDRWRLNRAAVRVGSLLRKCRYPDEALKELEQVTFPDESRLSTHREAYSTILQAKAYIDKGEHEFATQLAKDATGIMREMKSYVQVPYVDALYSTLKESKYGNSKAVLKLGVDLLKVQRPELFPVD